MPLCGVKCRWFWIFRSLKPKPLYPAQKICGETRRGKYTALNLRLSLNCQAPIFLCCKCNLAFSLFSREQKWTKLLIENKRRLKSTQLSSCYGKIQILGQTATVFWWNSLKIFYFYREGFWVKIMQVNSEKCVMCRECESACSKAWFKEESPELSRVKLLRWQVLQISISALSAAPV